MRSKKPRNSKIVKLEFLKLNLEFPRLKLEFLRQKLEFLEFNYKNFIRNSRILILKNSKNLEFLEVFI